MAEHKIQMTLDAITERLKDAGIPREADGDGSSRDDADGRKEDDADNNDGK